MDLRLARANRILVVDDEPDLEALVRQRMRREIRSGKFVIEFAQNGLEALAKMEQQDRFDMVLSDINMPKMNGLELLERIPEVDPDVRAVIVSAYGDMRNIRTAMNRGAFDFVTKPVDFGDLRVTIDRTLENSQIWREAMESRSQLVALENELNVARRMQASILPTKFPQGETFEVCANMQPARAVGGDFYDVLALDRGRVGMAIADVSGKGVPAGLFMMSSRTLLKGAAIGSGDPGKVLTTVNSVLSDDNAEMMFVTVLYAVFDPETRDYTYASGGHDSPLVVHADGTSTLLPHTGGIALGVMPDVQYRSNTVTLEQGDTVLLYTDGVTEAQDPDKQQFGLQRLKDIFREQVPTGAEPATGRVFQAVREFAGRASQFDDITCLALFQRAEAGVSNRLSLNLESSLDALGQIEQAVEAFGAENEWPMDLVFHVHLVLDELATNVVTHGYGESGHTFQITIESTSEAVTIKIVDEARPFDPLKDAPQPTIDASVEDRKVGGLGVHFAKQMMDEMTYKHEGGKNCLTLVKKR